MNLKTFLEHFETIAEAPSGIQKLRSLILDLAVRGKLVPQNPNDESAQKLVSKIEADIKKISHKKNSIQNISELPFNLPSTWKSVCLDQITLEVHYGLTASANFANNQIKLLRITDIQDNSVNWSSVPGCDIEPNKAKRYRLSNSDIVIARTGGTVGKSYLIEALKEEEFVVFASYLIRVVPVPHIYCTYLKLVLESPIYWVQLSSSTTGTGQPNVNATSLKGFVLPLPPLAEQKRIVEKVDELMELCDRFSTAKQTRDNLRHKLRGSAIAALMNAETDDELGKSWAIVRDNWHTLSQDPKDVDDLRRSVLQLAVRGKLISQKSTDDSVPILLDKIEYEKKRLNLTGSIKRSSTIPLEKNAIPCEVPKTWMWVKFNNVILDIEAGTSPQCEKRIKEQHEWGIIKISAISWNKFNPRENKALPISLEPIKKFEIKVGDFLMSRANTSQLVGKSVVVESTPPRLLINDKTLRVVFPSFLEKRFFNLYNNSLIARQYYAGEGTGTSDSMKNITREQIRNLPVPLPPLDEQKRIVAKVDELMQRCDALEEGLRQSQQRAEALAASAVCHLTI